MVLALGAAVYLNWRIGTPAETSKTLGESKLVNATVATEETQPQKKESDSKQSLPSKQQRLFSSAKTERDQIQDKIIDKAAETMKLEGVSENDMNTAQSQVAAVIKSFTLQNTIESTLKSKGFSSCLCYINDDGCIVTVPKAELKKLGTMIVKSTVQSVASIPFDKITIVSV